MAIVPVPCSRCKAQHDVEAEADHKVCPQCANSTIFRRCARCSGTAQVSSTVGRGGWWRCPWCQNKNKIAVFGNGDRSTAEALHREIVKRGLGGQDPNRRVLGGLKLVEGHGHGLPIGTICSVITTSECVTIMPETGGSPQSHPYAEIVSVEIGGRGLLRTGTRLRGGGFGLTAAVEGILIASAINKATSGTQMDSSLKVATKSGYYAFRSGTHTPVQVQQTLSFLLEQVRRLTAGPDATPAASDNDVLDQLKKLGELRDTGVLSDEEFQAAKARLVGELT